MSERQPRLRFKKEADERGLARECQRSEERAELEAENAALRESARRMRVHGSSEAMGALMTEKDAEIRLLRDRCAELEAKIENWRCAQTTLQEPRGLRSLLWEAINELADVEKQSDAARVDECLAWQNTVIHAQEERDAAIKRASDREIECGRLERQLKGVQRLRRIDLDAILSHDALLYECRKQFMAGAIPCQTVGYVKFRQRLDAAIDGLSTYPCDTRPKEAK